MCEISDHIPLLGTVLINKGMDVTGQASLTHYVPRELGNARMGFIDPPIE